MGAKVTNAGESPMWAEEIPSWIERLTNIGRKLGLEGSFCAEFGFDQIEERIGELTTRAGGPQPLPAELSALPRWELQGSKYVPLNDAAKRISEALPENDPFKA